MKSATSLLLATLASTAALGAAEPKVIEIWPEGVPGPRAGATPQKLESGRVSNVHKPTLTIFPAPAGTANGTAVIICPGGGYMRLSDENERSLMA
jgi:hypothetical protein